MVDLGPEKALWWNHWVLFREEKLEVEHATFVWGVSRSSNLHIEVSAVFLGRLSIDAHDYQIELELTRGKMRSVSLPSEMTEESWDVKFTEILSYLALERVFAFPEQRDNLIREGIQLLTKFRSLYPYSYANSHGKKTFTW